MPSRDVLQGGIDHLDRPFVKLDAAGFSEPLTAFIDTGFNGSMIVDEYQAERMGLEVIKHHLASAVLASQRAETFLLCRGRINWLGEEPFISAFVISETEEERLARRKRKREDEVVMGASFFSTAGSKSISGLGP